jgi:hypothetical protein
MHVYILGKKPHLDPEHRLLLSQGEIQPSLRRTPGAHTKRQRSNWDRHYLYNPETMAKIIKIYRLSLNWIGNSSTKTTPAMKLGLAKDKNNPQDLLG